MEAANGFGAVFELIPQTNGAFKQNRAPTASAAILWMVRDHRPDLSFDGAGNLYGTTVHGGPSSNCKGALLKPIGCGTVFE